MKSVGRIERETGLPQSTLQPAHTQRTQTQGTPVPGAPLGEDERRAAGRRRPPAARQGTAHRRGSSDRRATTRRAARPRERRWSCASHSSPGLAGAPRARVEERCTARPVHVRRRGRPWPRRERSGSPAAPAGQPHKCRSLYSVHHGVPARLGLSQQLLIDGFEPSADLFPGVATLDLGPACAAPSPGARRRHVGSAGSPRQGRRDRWHRPASRPRRGLPGSGLPGMLLATTGVPAGERLDQHQAE